MNSNSIYILAIDQGTTSTRAMIFDFGIKESPKLLAKGSKSFLQHYPIAGFVEHNLDEIWDSLKEATKEALSEAVKNDKNFSPKKIISIGITNQRETIGFWDSENYSPPRNAMVWQCVRGANYCAELKEQDLETSIIEKTGLLLNPYFSASKLTWLLKQEPKIKNDLISGKLLTGTIDTYLLYRLSNKESFATEPSNACRTSLYNINTLCFDSDLLEMFQIPKIRLPEVKNSIDHFGTTKNLDFLPDGIPINCILGDQQAALAGQGCFTKSSLKCTYGTGAFVLVNIDEEQKTRIKNVLTTIAWKIGNKTTYALEGSVFIAGGGVEFLSKNLKFFENPKDSNDKAYKYYCAPDLIFAPSFCGLGAPHWLPQAKGSIFGLTRDTDQRQITRACLEGICFQVNDFIETLINAGIQSQDFYVDGGAAKNDLLMQIQADISNICIKRSSFLESTGYGVAIFAALGQKIFSDFSELGEIKKKWASFTPQIPAKQQILIKKAWQQAIEAIALFSKKDKTP